MVGISGVAVCLCPYPCFCLHFWQVCCFAAEVEPDAHAPLPVSAATVAAAGRVFVRPAEAAVAASAVVPVLSVPVAGSRCWPGAKWEDGPDRGSNSHWDSRSGWRWYLD